MRFIPVLTTTPGVVPRLSRSAPPFPAALTIFAGQTKQFRRHGASVRAQAASLTLAPGRWLGPQTAGGSGGLAQRQQQLEEQQGPPVYGVELTAEQWDPLGLAAEGSVFKVGPPAALLAGAPAGLLARG